MSRLIGSWTFSAGLAASVALASCSGAQSEDVPAQHALGALALSEDAAGTSVNAEAGQEIDITLQTVGPGEYSTPSMSSGSVRFLDVSIPSTQNPGGVKQTFRFMAESTGTSEITIPHTVKSEAFDVAIVVE